MIATLGTTQAESLRPWTIYHREREYAREHGDRALGTVWANGKDEAEMMALRELGVYMPTGAWAVAEPEREGATR